jgi:hypothetical protein
VGRLRRGAVAAVVHGVAARLGIRRWRSARWRWRESWHRTVPLTLAGGLLDKEWPVARVIMLLYPSRGKRSRIWAVLLCRWRGLVLSRRDVAELAAILRLACGTWAAPVLWLLPIRSWVTLVLTFAGRRGPWMATVLWLLSVWRRTLLMLTILRLLSLSYLSVLIMQRAFVRLAILILLAVLLLLLLSILRLSRRLLAI